MANGYLQDSLMLFFIWLISIVLVRAFLRQNRTKFRLPPSPRFLPIIGHMHLLAPIPHQALHKLSMRYGPLIHIFIGSNPCVIASSPEVAKQILRTHELSFLNRPKMANPDYLTYGSADFTFAPYGPYWKFIKKLCMTQLLGGPTLEHLSPIRMEELKRFLKLMQRKAEEGEQVNVGTELMRLTNNIISRMALSQRCSDKEDEADKVRRLVREMTELAGKFNLSDSIWFCRNFDIQGFRKRLKDVRDRYDAMMERIIKEHLEARKEGNESKKRDLLDMLLDIYEDPSSKMRLTRENIKAFIMNIFGAGTDTSSITVEWALAELINNPEVMEKAREEIELVVGKNRVVAESDIPNLPYLQAIIKETLRLHPTGPLIVRESTEDCKINEYDIPARTRVFINVWALGRDPTHWESPLLFMPERFLNRLEEGNLDIRGQSFQLLPFGSGRRSCPGASLALQVVQSTLGAMIQCFDWKVSTGSVDMKEAPGLSLPRAHPILCLPVARLDPLPIG
ncbi:cytochrome P450 93A3-like [Punica granatum]|uniref:Uncharacterized protein n=2 Tax=Punica granatum TaxID=22663 RepID=A0A218W509_PUNGR|nr:cytochrome P450 93A3-like [Punica granatum]OWM67192.1 hypothetical protein CDL15_Pgr000644 [Punica granatum]PKI72206.1 hypothetical protein CRG98_007404 [Punica granatum]